MATKPENAELFVHEIIKANITYQKERKPTHAYVLTHPDTHPMPHCFIQTMYLDEKVYVRSFYRHCTEVFFQLLTIFGHQLYHDNKEYKDLGIIPEYVEIKSEELLQELIEMVLNNELPDINCQDILDKHRKLYEKKWLLNYNGGIIGHRAHSLFQLLFLKMLDDERLHFCKTFAEQISIDAAYCKSPSYRYTKNHDSHLTYYFNRIQHKEIII